VVENEVEERKWCFGGSDGESSGHPKLDFSASGLAYVNRRFLPALPKQASPISSTEIRSRDTKMERMRGEGMDRSEIEERGVRRAEIEEYLLSCYEAVKL